MSAERNNPEKITVIVLHDVDKIQISLRVHRAPRTMESILSYLKGMEMSDSDEGMVAAFHEIDLFSDIGEADRHPVKFAYYGFDGLGWVPVPSLY